MQGRATMDWDASTPKEHLCRERSLAEVRRFAHCFAFREFQFNATERGESLSYRLGEIFWWLRCWIIQRCAKDFSRFFFHRAAVVGCANAELHLGFVVDLAYGQRGHTSMLALLSVNASLCAGRFPNCRPHESTFNSVNTSAFIGTNSEGLRLLLSSDRRLRR